MQIRSNFVNMNWSDPLRFSFLILLITALNLVSCSSVTPVGQNKYPPVPIEHVKVLYQEPQRPYEVVALLSHNGVTRFANVTSEIENCRKLAAAAGADAVLITSTSNQTFSTAAAASAKAIKWKK